MPKTPPLARAVLVVSASLTACLNASPVLAQATDRDLEAIASWVAVDAATGYEGRVAAGLASALGGWQADRWGNVVTTVGSGSPHRIVACALDRPSLAVSQITDDGYLRVHRIGRGSRHPLWDQQFEAQQVRVLTPTGPVAGVVGRSNGHFAQQHRGDPVATADDLWLDVGAESRGEVEALGIGLLDPVTRQLPPWSMAGAVAGPDAGRRAGCAAVATLAAAARAGAVSGRVTFVLSAQEVSGWVGLSSLIARGGPVDGVTILAPGEEKRASTDRAAGTLGSFGEVLEVAGLATVHWLAPAVEQPGSHMEVVPAAESDWLLGAGAAAVDIGLGASRAWVPAPPPAGLRTEPIDASLAEVEVLLSQLVERYGVSGHEWAVRRLVLESLPPWARERAVVDDIGNIMVEAGPDRDTVVFMAHTDEVGYQVESIAPDGTVTLDTQGGAVSSAWEGQTALLHFDPPGAPSTMTGGGADTDPRWKANSLTATAPPPLRGVFRIRSEARQKNPDEMHAWFGLDAAGLAARGVRVGMQVTSHKVGLRLGRNRFVARSEDDRAGTTALLLAINQIDPDRLPGKVIFTWSVHEEGGLLGAAAMARRYARSARRIYSIDTFVSSDAPLESPHFAHALLGKGPVLRAIENSSVSPDLERARVRRAAEGAQIPIQLGLTQGGTDGTRFTFWGAPNQGLSWPGRYSHSPGEVLDLRDLKALSRLIVAVATIGEQQP